MNNIKLPTSWNDIDVYQFIELRKLDDSESSFFVRQIERLAIITDTDATDPMWEEMDVEDLSKMIDQIKWLKTEPTQNFKREINGMHIKNVNKFTLGEYIDLDFFSRSFFENLPKICAILYRKTRKNKWDNTVVEPYKEIDLEVRARPFEELPITDVYGVIRYFLNYKESFLDTYSKHFQQGIVDDYEDAGLTPQEIAEIEMEKKMADLWAWDNMIYDLTGGDPLKTDAVTNLPLIYVFNHMSMMKDLNLGS